MFNIKKNELAPFYEEIKKLGASVNEELKQVSFDIPNKRDEQWAVKIYPDGLLRGSFYIGYEKTYPVSSLQQATDECRNKIENALKIVRGE